MVATLDALRPNWANGPWGVRCVAPVVPRTGQSLPCGFLDAMCRCICRERRCRGAVGWPQVMWCRWRRTLGYDVPPAQSTGWTPSPASTSLSMIHRHAHTMSLTAGRGQWRDRTPKDNHRLTRSLGLAPLHSPVRFAHSVCETTRAREHQSIVIASRVTWTAERTSIRNSDVFSGERRIRRESRVAMPFAKLALRPSKFALKWAAHAVNFVHRTEHPQPGRCGHQLTHPRPESPTEHLV